MVDILIRDEKLLYGADYVPLTIEGDPGFLFQGTDPLNYSFGRANKTFNVQIIRNGRNNALLNNVFSANRIEQRVFDAIASVNGVFISGKLLIYTIGSDSVDAQFIGDMGGVWEELGDKNIRYDLDWSEYDHTYDHSTIYAIQLDTSSDIRYDNSYRGLYPGWKESWITPDPSLPGFTPVLGEVRPCLKLKAIVEKIFSDYTVSIEGLPEELWNDKLFYSTAPPVNEINPDLNIEINRTAADDNLDWNDLGNSPEIINNPSIFETDRIWEFSAEDLLGQTLNDTNSFMDIFIGADENRSFYFSFTPALHQLRLSILGISTEAIITERVLSYSIEELNSSGTPIRTYRLKEFSLPNVNLTSSSPQTDTLTTLFSDAFIKLESGMIRLLSNTRRVRFTVKYSHHQVDGVVGTSPLEMKLEYKRLPADLTGSELVSRNIPWTVEGMTIPGRNMAPDVDVRTFMKNFLTYFNLEMYVDDISKRIDFRNRFNTLSELYDLSPYIIEGSLQTEIEPEPPNYRIQLGVDTDDVMTRPIEESGYINYDWENDLYNEIGSFSTNIDELFYRSDYIQTFLYRLDINRRRRETIPIDIAWTLSVDSPIGAPILLKKDKDNEDLRYTPADPYNGELLTLLKSAEYSLSFKDRLQVWSGTIDWTTRYMQDPAPDNPDLNYVPRNWPVDVWSNFYLDGEYSLPGVAPTIGENALYLGMKTPYENRSSTLVSKRPQSPYLYSFIVPPLYTTTPPWGDIYRSFHQENLDRIDEGKTLKARVELPPDFLNGIASSGGRDLSATYYIGEEDFMGYYQIISMEKIEGDIWSLELIETNRPLITVPGGTGSFSADYSSDFDI